MTACKVMPHLNCRPHPFQDRHYGPGVRVFNYGRASFGAKQPGWTCTVCGVAVPAAGIEAKKKGGPAPVAEAKETLTKPGAKGKEAKHKIERRDRRK